ncbi:MAG: hypothetical protein ABI415_00870, partial [Flavitalea sp.]
TPITFSQFPILDSEPDFIQQFNNKLNVSLQRAVLCGTYPDSRLIQWLISNYSGKSGISNANLIADFQQRYKSSAEKGTSTVLKNLKPGIVARDVTDVALNLLGILILFIPAGIGWLLHAPLYYPLRKFVYNRTKSTVFYDSALFSGLMILYPIYWMTLNILVALVITNITIMAVIFLMPAFSWLYLIWKDCVKSIQNYLLLPRNQRELVKEVLFA